MVNHGKPQEITGNHRTLYRLQVIMRDHGDIMGNFRKLWEITGVNGKITGSHRELQEFTGNHKKSWEIMGHYGKLRKYPGKIMGNNGRLWQNHGKSWKIMGKSWKIAGNHGNFTVSIQEKNTITEFSHAWVKLGVTAETFYL